MTETTRPRATLVLGGAGRTGRRTVERLTWPAPDVADHARAAAVTDVGNPTDRPSPGSHR